MAQTLARSDNEILGIMVQNYGFDLAQEQRDAWLEQLSILRKELPGIEGHLFFEFAVPRLGGFIDAVVVVGPFVMILEFKVGESEIQAKDLDQVWDYALDLKNFHETSHAVPLIPVLLPSEAREQPLLQNLQKASDLLFHPIAISSSQLGGLIRQQKRQVPGNPVSPLDWAAGRYLPTPTIIEAAKALYQGHSVEEITRSDASRKNLTTTTNRISNIINAAKLNHEKAICFVTGVPGAGKTLVGLNIATRHMKGDKGEFSTFLSGNGPLVRVLQEALARNHIDHAKQRQERITKKDARQKVQSFIQNVHHYRDEYLRDKDRPPTDHVALFDEAQRAWNLEQTRNFMARKKGIQNFDKSEPEFLISCIDRHEDWGVVVALVGGGQEINTGEAGIKQWLEAIRKAFPKWKVYISPNLSTAEYGAEAELRALDESGRLAIDESLHLGTSIRSFRAENLSNFVRELLELDLDSATTTFQQFSSKYPIALTRDLNLAKEWLRTHARGSERFGLVASSQAERLRPHAIDVRVQTDPVHYFLDPKEDVRSSYYLEDPATEFDIQGLELDWTCVTWDADFRHDGKTWRHFSFKGSKWQNINSPVRQQYQKNAYRVLLTRARQGMVVFVPKGESGDPTRVPRFYDGTYDYLKSLGLNLIG